MKNLLRRIILLIIGLSFTACVEIATPISTPVASPTIPATATFTPVPSPIATAAIGPASQPEFVPPTLIPTIDPTLVPGLLSEAFSVQTIEGVNGHTVRQITGWDHGFGGGYWSGYCPSYYWLDNQHLLVYPATGQTGPIEGVGKINVVPQPVVINLETGSSWLPPANQSGSPLTCNRVYWSQELGMLITTESILPTGSNQELRAVSTYTFEGEEIAHYWGGLRDVSPSGMKILVADDTLIDLRNNTIIDFDWYINLDRVNSSRIYWSADESRVYRCCYYFGDSNTGTSYDFEVGEFVGTGAKPSSSATHGYGQWVRGGDYFLIEWSVVDDGYPDFFPMFDPVAKKYYEVSEMAGVPSDWTCAKTNVSPDGMHLWLECWEGSYLINLENFQSRAYPNYSNTEIEWSNDGQFARIRDFTNDLWQVLSVSSKELMPLSVRSLSGTTLLWHPTENTLGYLYEDAQKLELLDAQTMSAREVVLPARFYGFSWNPTGNILALVAEDGSLWQVDYPNFQYFEQLTEPQFPITNVVWSHDGNSVAFTGGTDIYVVEISK